MTTHQIISNTSFSRLSTKDYVYHPALINGIQRIMLNYLSAYTFDMFLDTSDYTFLSDTLNIPRLNPKHQRYTTLSCNTQFPIPMISLHVSRQAISSEAIIDGVDILANTPDRKVYFAVCATESEEPDPIKQITKPLVNLNASPLVLYAHDLVPFVFTRNGDVWSYNGQESYTVKQNLDKVFVYNGKVALIEHGKHLNILLKAMKVTGKKDPAGSPCRSSYRWVMNPVFKESHPVVDDNFVLRRKIEGQPSAKDMFLMAPTQESHIYGNMTYQNKFGKPYGLDLIFAYNGKQNPLSVMNDAISTFIDNLKLMNAELNRGDIIHQTHLDTSVTLTIPLNVDMNLNSYQNGKYQVLLDDSLLHAVSVKVLELLDGIIMDDISVWEHISVYYKVPHRLIAQSVLHVKLPETASREFTDAVKAIIPSGLANPDESLSVGLIRTAIHAVISDLETLKN